MSQRIKTFLKNDLWIFALDVVSVNLAYWLALIMRFFVNGEFRVSVGYYVEYFYKIAPWYTVLAIATFFIFRLYGGMWRYAGMNDMNRIALANLVTLALQVAISLVVIRTLKDGRADRMPYTYYIIGAVLQFLLTSGIRFAYRLLLIEKRKIASRQMETIPAIVIGSGDMGRKVVHHLEDNTPYRAIAVIGDDHGRSMDGVPILPFTTLTQTVKDKKIENIFIADTKLSKAQRDEIKALSKTVTDYTGHLSNESGFLPLTNLLDVMDMPIVVDVDGQETKFNSADECLATLPGEYDIQRVTATKLYLRKREQDTSWMRVYQEQTGQEVSFF